MSCILALFKTPKVAAESTAAIEKDPAPSCASSETVTIDEKGKSSFSSSSSAERAVIIKDVKVHSRFAAGSDAAVFRCEVTYEDSHASKEATTNRSTLVKPTDAVLKVNRPEQGEMEPSRLHASLLLPGVPNISDIRAIQHRAHAEIVLLGMLKPVQGVYVPRLLGTLGMKEAPISHCEKLILDNGGSTLRDLAYYAPYLYFLWASDIHSEARKAVYACHKLGVIHQGLHAQNILVHWVSSNQSETAKKNKGNSDCAQQQKHTNFDQVDRLCRAPDSRKLRKPAGMSVRVYLIDWTKGKVDGSWCSKMSDRKRLQKALATCKSLAWERD